MQVSTSCTQLSTISALLLDYIPTIETPHPATTYGLPLEPNSATARRQAIMGEEAQLISQYGSTGRRQGALAIAVPGMRLNPATDPSRAALSHPNGHPSLTGPPPILGMNGHPTHARVQSVNGLHNGVRAQAQAQSNGLHPGAGQEWRPVTAVDAVREKKRKGRESGYDEDEVYDSGEFAPRAPAKRQKGAAAAPAANDNHPLPALPALPANGHPPPDLPTAHAPAPPKKAAARRKPAKQAAATAVPLPTAPVAATLPPPAAIPDRAVAVDKVPVEVISAGEVAPEVEDQDLYCFCQTPSYGEMIGCDRDECERQWVCPAGLGAERWRWTVLTLSLLLQFHLPCVGLKAIPKGSWYCDDCVAIVSALETYSIAAVTPACVLTECGPLSQRNRPADNKKAAKRR